MTPRILDSDYANRIRKRLGVDESHLSTEEIDEVLPEIEADFCGKVTDWATIILTDTDKRMYLRSSIVCKAASVLCSVMKAKFPNKEQGPSGSFEKPVNWGERKVELEQESNRLLSKVKPPTVYSHFKVVN